MPFASIQLRKARILTPPSTGENLGQPDVYGLLVRGGRLFLECSVAIPAHVDYSPSSRPTISPSGNLELLDPLEDL